MIRSAAMMLELSLGHGPEARLVHAALDRTIELAPTQDVGGPFTTSKFGDVMIDELTHLMANVV
jgi:isocitrate/isopropylmalate dehydrogenase